MFRHKIKKRKKIDEKLNTRISDSPVISKLTNKHGASIQYLIAKAFLILMFAQKPLIIFNLNILPIK
jgi:hypothetical protein